MGVQEIEVAVHAEGKLGKALHEFAVEAQARIVGLEIRHELHHATIPRRSLAERARIDAHLLEDIGDVVFQASMPLQPRIERPSAEFPLILRPWVQIAFSQDSVGRTPTRFDISDGSNSPEIVK